MTQNKDSGNAKDDSIQLCTFEINKRIFGIDLLDVREVSQKPQATPIFHASPVVSGYINIRGEIHLLLDLRVILGQQTDSSLKSQCVIIFKPNVGELFGSIVDSVRGVITIGSDEIENYQAFKSVDHSDDHHSALNSIASGVCKMKGYLITILDSRKFLGTINNAS